MSGRATNAMNGKMAEIIPPEPDRTSPLALFVFTCARTGPKESELLYPAAA